MGLIPQRIAAAVAGALGVVGLLLAAIGIFGVTAYAVTRRTREIGIRVALGADHREVMRLLLRQGLMLTAIGLVLGLGLAALGAQLIQGLLYGVSGVDPVTFGGACALFADRLDARDLRPGAARTASRSDGGAAQRIAAGEGGLAP